jgi:FdrA protein
MVEGTSRMSTDESQDIARSTVIANRYRDSVALLRLATELGCREGIARATVVMATTANLADAAENGFAPSDAATPSANDIFVGVTGTAKACEAALLFAQNELETTRRRRGPSTNSDSTVEADRTLWATASSLKEADPHCNDPAIAMISVPGEYAAAEAHKALALGMHVMMFSDNVSIEDELALKTKANDAGLLMMGPDCGTALLNGVPFGFVNAVRRGPIAVIGASGTGMQEIMVGIHRLGSGISQAIGCGGRDLSETNAGATMRQALRLLQDDPDTQAIVLVSKPPHPSVLRTLLDDLAPYVAANIPIILAMPGLETAQTFGDGITLADSLAHAAELVVAQLHRLSVEPSLLQPGHLQPSNPLLVQAQSATSVIASVNLTPTSGLPFADNSKFLPAPVSHPSTADNDTQRRTKIVGAFVGGTLCSEYQWLSRKLPEPFTLQCTDFGDDEYTKGRPHPMIDPAVRDAAIARALLDPTVALIHFDVVLGHGSTPGPTAQLAKQFAHRDANGPILVCHLLGTELDPQPLDAIVATLKSLGVHMARTNAESVRVATDLLAPSFGELP